jgi:ABC-type amino acid transport system permease subunit
MTYPGALVAVIIPQATRRVVPPLMNDFINITKETSLIAFLGVSIAGRELYTVGSQGYSQFFNSTFFVASALGYLVMILPLIGLVNIVERRIRSGLVSVGA